MTDIKQSHWSDVTNSCGGRKKKSCNCSRAWRLKSKSFTEKRKLLFFSLLFIVGTMRIFLFLHLFTEGPCCIIMCPPPFCMYSLLWCAFKSMPRESMFPKQMKRAKANQKLVICRMSQRHCGSSVLSQSSCFPPCLRGLFFFPPLVSLSYMLPELGTGSQEGSIGMVAPLGNQLYTGYEAFIFCTEALNGFDIPWWITTTKWEGERRGGGGVEKAGDWKRKIQEEFFAFAPSGCRVCWWSTVRFSGKRISAHPPTHASLSKSQRRSSFIHRSSCAARLLLIKQWQTPFDRSWRKFHLYRDTREIQTTGVKFSREAKWDWTLHHTALSCLVQIPTRGRRFMFSSKPRLIPGQRTHHYSHASAGKTSLLEEER